MHQIPTHKGFSYCLAAVFPESLETISQVENEDVVGAAPTGDAPTTSEWSTILLPTNVRLILEILQYILLGHCLTLLAEYERVSEWLSLTAFLGQSTEYGTLNKIYLYVNKTSKNISEWNCNESLWEFQLHITENCVLKI